MLCSNRENLHKISFYEFADNAKPLIDDVMGVANNQLRNFDGIKYPCFKHICSEGQELGAFVVFSIVQL